MKEKNIEKDHQSDFFGNPILNSPYEKPSRHWKLDESGQPTEEIEEGRRSASFVTPVARIKHISTSTPEFIQEEFDLGDQVVFNDIDDQKYNQTYSLINEIRSAVDSWHMLPESQWGVTAETARLLRHWRTHPFQRQRPFFCQIEAAEVVIWLTEVAPQNKKWKSILDQIRAGNEDANPGLIRIALKLATGAGKTTVMAMLIAWQTINAVRHPNSKLFTKAFLVVTPGITIRDRLRVLYPNDPESYYLNREIIPKEFELEIRKAILVVTNYHAFKLRDTMEISKGARRLLQGRMGEEIITLETEGQMLQRVMKELMGQKHILIINDEAHHCYREKPQMTKEKIDAAEKEDVEKRREMARLWISGLEAVTKRFKGSRIIDLSATPFFLRGSGYAEGTLFPWTACDFSLMDAIECGIVKLPRVPVADNNPIRAGELPVFRDLWKHVGKDMPKKNKAHSGILDPGKLPLVLCNAIDSLYGHYAQTAKLWEESGMSVPPCFIIVCQNTAISKLLFDYVSGYRLGEDGQFQHGKCELFSNFNSDGTPLERPRTILVDSHSLESDDPEDRDRNKAFWANAADEIAQFKREMRERGGYQTDIDKIKDSDLLREVLNTVGKPGKLGAGVRCVVSVSMLTEGWDANNVTHILGLRAFGTQLICEQVIGRALRRSSYELDDQNHLPPEYADIYGIPFDFIGKAVASVPNKPKKVVEVRAVHPERDYVEITFPNVAGYRVELGEEKLEAKWTEESDFTLSPDIVGPGKVEVAAVVGKSEHIDIRYLKNTRTNTIVYVLTKHLIECKFRDAGEEPKLYLFGQLKAIVEDWVKNHLHTIGETCPAQVLYRVLADRVCERIARAITNSQKENRVIATINPYNPKGSTHHVRFKTSKADLWATNEKSHVNYAVLDSDWESECCRVLEKNPHVRAYVKNSGLGFKVPYLRGMEEHDYYPDFIAVLDNGEHIVLEVKGFKDEDVKEKKDTMNTLWIPGVNNHGAFGVWHFAQLEEVFTIEDEFNTLVAKILSKGN